MEVDAVTLGDLVPILATVLGSMLVFAAALMRYQHVDSTKTRDLIDQTSKENRELIKENRELIEKKSDENRELIKEKSDENRELIKENRELVDRNRDLIEKYHMETAASIGEVRERLARIEGRLEVSPPPPPDDTTAEAA
ncbi:hypothetical protein [Candidatus Poriferisocius sp.]|uniref:hypothetical protein n=1 Tax=Candidatus Poriferisocius sp. TaxID=3101276 RepID=UPI003B02B6E7